MFYLSSIRLNTQMIWCWVIIDRNKLIEVTTLFHLGIAYNIMITAKMKECDFLINIKIISNLPTADDS